MSAPRLSAEEQASVHALLSTLRAQRAKLAADEKDGLLASGAVDRTWEVVEDLITSHLGQLMPLEEVAAA